MIKISVIVPVYNVEKYLNRCVDSILDQTYKNLEIILVDDGSTDSSGIICDKYAKIDNRIKVIHKKNGGLSDARNFGISMATGEYISFIDSDDFIDKNLYNDFHKYYSGADIYIFGVSNVYEGEELVINNKIKVNKINKIECIKKILKNELNNYACDKIFKKELFNDVSFPLNRAFEDIGTIYKLVLKSSNIIYNSREYYGYFQRTNSITGSMTEKSIKDRIILEKERFNYIFENYKELENDIINDRIFQIYRYHIDVCKYIKGKSFYNSQLLKEEYEFLKNNYKFYNNKNVLFHLLCFNRNCFYFVIKLLLFIKK